MNFTRTAAGALPPPGLYGLVYANHYRADRFDGGDGQALIPGFKVRANVLVGRLVYMSDTQVLGGQLGVYGVLPLVDLQVEAGGARGSHTGLGDLEAGPLIAWHHSPQLHTTAALVGCCRRATTTRTAWPTPAAMSPRCAACTWRPTWASRSTRRPS